MRRRFLIVHNQHAGTWSRWLLRAVGRRLEHAGAILTTEHAAHLDQDREVARAAAASGGFDAVVAAGGDSTVRGVASGLIGSGVPLGIIPVGTGNVVAREIGMRGGADAIARALLEGPSVRVACGLADGTPFLAMTGVGYDADVILNLNTTWKRSLGRLAYAWPILRQALRTPTPFSVTADGRELPATWLIATRTAHYGGAFVVAKEQRLTDDGFRAIVIDARTRRALAGTLVALARGRHEARPDVTVIPCTRVSVRSCTAVAAQIDGERIASPPAEITLSQERLNLIVPPWSALAGEAAPDDAGSCSAGEHQAGVDEPAVKR